MRAELPSAAGLRRLPWSQALRVLAGTLGAYAVAALCAWSLSLSLPLSRIDATLAATQLGFVAGAVAVIVAFGARRVWRAWGWLFGMAALLALPGLITLLLGEGPA